MSCGKLSDILYITGVTNYLEFQCVDGSFVYSGKNKQTSKMPSTPEEAMKSPLLSLMQKLKFKSFLTALAGYEIPGEDGVDSDEDVPLNRMTMRELMMTLVRNGRAPRGAVYTQWSWFNRTGLYSELDDISGMQYVRRFILPYYKDKTVEQLQYESSLYSSVPALKSEPKIRVLHNADDLILDSSERDFLDSLFGSRLTWFDCGGISGHPA